MKVVQALTLLLVATCVFMNAAAQCTGNCPVGSLAIPVSSATLAAGNTYCISSSINLSGNSYTINGTLVIQTGNVSIGNVNIEKTGVILVKNGARLTITGNITGNATTPVSTIDNLVICNGGLMHMVGSFSQGQTNIAVNDFGALEIEGAWTAGATSSTVKMGKGSVIELCASFNLNKDGFFIETSTDPSYLVSHAPMQQSIVNGWLSNLQSGSKINWTAAAGAAFVSHPNIFSCLPSPPSNCTDFHLAPTGTNGSCGSAANALYNTVLISPDKPAVRFDDDNIDKPVIYPNPAKKYVYLQLPKKHTYTHLAVFTQAGQLVQQATVKAGSAPTRYDLPAPLQPGLYFIKLTGKEGSITFKIAKD